MAPASRFGLMGRGPVAQKERDVPTTWRHDDAVPSRNPKTMSKAERLLGVGNGSGAAIHQQQQQQRSMSDLSKRSQKGKGFSSAFSDLKGKFAGGSSSNSRNSSQSRRTPSSPAIKTNTDSDSVTSMTSPTFDPTGSTSTLPSYYEPPMSPYFPTRGSSGPSSPNDLDGRHDYHAALGSSRHKGQQLYGKDMPAISEVYDNTEDKDELPPLEMPPLSPSQISTPKRRGSFTPVNRLRSPSSTSVATESTTKGKWLGWRQSRLQGKDLIIDSPLPKATDQYNATAKNEYNSLSSKPSSAVEDWLARADLKRRPSQASTMTGTTTQHMLEPTTFSPNSSELSIRTLTTQKDAVLAPPCPPIAAPILRHAKSSNDIPKPSKEPKFSALHAKDLLVDSVLYFSSSEDESSDGEEGATKRTSKRVSIIRTADNTAKLYVNAPRQAQGSSKQSLDVKQRSPRSLNQQSSPPKPAIKQAYRVAPPLVSPKPVRPPTGRRPFADVEWQASDATELGNVCLETADKVYPVKPSNPIEVTNKRVSQISSLSPTSKVMVVSKKEEKLLAAMRGKKDHAERPMSGDSTTTSSTTPIIQVSPPRRGKAKKARSTEGTEEMTKLDENSVLNFPAPPTPKNRGNILALKVSTESLPELPEVIINDCDNSDAVSLPSILLSPSIASRLSLNNYSSVSDLTPSDERSDNNVPDVPPIPNELYGSVPDLTEVLHTGLSYKNSNRSKTSDRSRGSSKSKVYITGLEHHGGGLEDSDLEEGDLAKYVMASCM